MMFRTHYVQSEQHCLAIGNLQIPIFAKNEIKIKMNTNSLKLYSGDGGNAQHIFIKDAHVGWKSILNDPQRHLGGGVAQYDYMESLYKLLSGQARRLLDKWSWTKGENPYILEAIAREEDRAVWRTYYIERTVYNPARVYMIMTTAMPTRPDQLPEPIQEPANLEEFLAIIRAAF